MLSMPDSKGRCIFDPLTFDVGRHASNIWHRPGLDGLPRHAAELVLTPTRKSARVDQAVA